MIQSLNTKVDIVVDATSYISVASYGKIMIGDRGFEFYDNRNTKNYIQIPWSEVDYVIASVLFKGKWIPRYAIQTKGSGTFSFASKKTKDVLRAINQYVDSSHVVQSLSFFEVVKRGIKAKFNKQKSV